ncbi:MAG: hypothetical protein M1833_001528, partial [Piccolia ochrophora]
MRLDVKLDSPLNSGVARERSRKPWNPKRGYHPSPQSQRHRFADTEGMLAGVRYRAIDHNIAQGYRQLGPAPGDPDWEDIEQRFESKLLRRGLSSTLNELDSEKRSVLAAHPSSPSLTSAISNTPAGQGVGEAYKAIIPTVAFILTQQHFGQKVSPLKGDEPLVRGQVAHLMGLDHGDAKVTIPSTRPTRSLVHKKGATLDFLSYYSQKSAGRPMLRRQHEHADAQVFREKPYMVRSLSVELDEFERQPAILKNAMVGIKQAASGQLEGTDAAKSALAELPILFYSDRGTLWLRKHDYASFLRLAFKSLDTKKTEQHSFHFIVDVEEPKKPIRAYELNDDNGLVVYHANIKTNFNGDNCRFRIRAKNSEEAQPFVPNDEQKLVTFVNRQIGSYYWRPLPTFWQNGAEDSRPEKEDNTGTTYGERSKNFVKQVLHFFFGRPSTDMKMIIPGKPTFTIATSDSRSALSKEVQNILKDLLNPSRRMKTVRVGLYESSQSPTEAVHLHEPKPPAQAKGEEPRKAGSIQREPEKHFASESQPSSKTVQEDFDQTIQRFIQQRQAADSEAMRRLVNGQQPRVSPVDEGDNRVQQPPTSDDVYIEGLASRQRIVWRRPYNVASFLSMVVPLLQLDKKPRFTVRVYAGQQCYDQGIFDLVQHSTDPHAVMISDAAYETLKGDTIYVAPHLDSIDVYDLNKGKDEQPTGWVNAPNQQNFHFLLSYMYDVDLDHGGLIVVGVTSSSGKELLRYHTKGSQEDLRRRIWDKLESDGKLYLKVIRDVLSPHIEDGAPAVESRESVERTGNHDSSQGKSGDVVASDDVQEARRQYAQRSEEHDKRIREQQDARLFPKSVYDQPMSEMQLQTPIPSYEPEIRGGVDFPSLYARVLTISEVENLQRELRRCQNELLGREEYCRVCKRAFEFEGGEGQGIQAHYQEHLQEGIHRCPLCGDGACDRKSISTNMAGAQITQVRDARIPTEVCKHLRVHFIKEIKAKKATKSSENGEEGPNTWGPTVVTFFQDAKAAEDYNFPSKRSHGGSPSAAGPRSQPPLPPINRPPTRDPEKKKVVKFAQDLSPGEKSYPTTPPMIQRDEIALKDDKSLSSSSSNDSGSSYQESTVQEPQSLADHQAVEH